MSPGVGTFGVIVTAAEDSVYRLAILSVSIESGVMRIVSAYAEIRMAPLSR
jgi:hypothetical protein